jgi:hypothetical protein
MYIISHQTLILVVVFAFGYMFFMIRKTARQQLDIYDLVMLSTVAIVPSIFVVFPDGVFWITKIVGVKFPFVVMFGMLFAILFVFVHRLTVKLHRLESDNRLLIQEIGLLKQTIEQPAAMQND